jgi:hypothetical protein
VSNHLYRIRPLADRETRQSAVDEIRKMIETGRYFVPADQVVSALLAAAGFFEPDASSCGGQDADAK